jgi:CubicO group peptidase (beta-lactamase class C family)
LVRSIVLCALLALPLAAVASIPGLPAALAAELESQGLQGAVWSTLEPDGRITAGAHGIKDARSGRRLAPTDRVHVGSIAKTVLATGILRLVSEGRLGLDSPVSGLLPEVDFENPWGATHPVTVRHLLGHTAGLDDARFSQVFSLTATAGMPLKEGLARAGLPLTVRSRPGARHSYSNTGYLLLGMVIEKTTAMPYERYLDTHVLEPLGLSDSTAAFTTQEGASTDPRLAMGHFENGATQAAVPSTLRPAGQFTTTAGDMAKLAHFLMGDGRIRGAPSSKEHCSMRWATPPAPKPPMPACAWAMHWAWPRATGTARSASATAAARSATRRCSASSPRNGVRSSSR